MEQIVLIIHTLAAAIVIGLVLMQHGKGADMGASFGGGGGASGSLFGVSGSSNLLSRLTALFVVVFFSTSLILGYMSSHKGSGSVIASQPAAEVVADEVKKDNATSTDDIPK